MQYDVHTQLYSIKHIWRLICKQNDEETADQDGAGASLGQAVDYIQRLLHQLRSGQNQDGNRNDQGGDRNDQDGDNNDQEL